MDTPLTTGTTSVDDLKKAINADTACVIVQYVNYFGCLEDLQTLADETHKAGALLLVITDPISLGMLKAPGDQGADIVVGDAQSCGNSLSFGGPSAGYMACRTEYIRQLPGRLAGMTVDNRGQKAFTLTLQTREQHIRRAKATSNICTNQALNALAMLVYLTCVGPKGLYDLSNIGVQRAHYLADKLTAISGVKLTFDKPFFNEFALSVPVDAQVLLDNLKSKGILAGINLTNNFASIKNSILIAVTEMNTVEEIDQLVEAMKVEVTSLAKGTSQGAAKQKALTV